MHKRTLMLLFVFALSMRCTWNDPGCPAPGQWWTCTEMLTTVNPGKTGYGCDRPKIAVCVTDTEHPNAQAIYIATVRYGAPRNPELKPLYDSALSSTLCTQGKDPNANADPNFHPEDYPASVVPADTGGGSSSASYQAIVANPGAPPKKQRRPPPPSRSSASGTPPPARCAGRHRAPA
jgi:hypothetical protein